MSKNEATYLIHDDVYEPDGEMWNLVHLALGLPADRYVNPPRFYVGLMHGRVLGTAFDHFSIYFILAGHYRNDATWWNLFGEKQVPSAMQLIMRVFYHDEPPTRENTDLFISLTPPGCIYIEEIRMGYTPQVLMAIVGLEHVAPEDRINATRRILPGLGLFHPNTLAVIRKSTHGGARYIKVADWPKEHLQKLGSEYAVLTDVLTTVKKDAKKYHLKDARTWRSHLELDYPVLKDHPDILDKIGQVYFGYESGIHPSVTSLEPYQIAWEIAARLSSPLYNQFSATAETLSKHAILQSE